MSSPNLVSQVAARAAKNALVLPMYDGSAGNDDALMAISASCIAGRPAFNTDRRFRQSEELPLDVRSQTSSSALCPQAALLSGTLITQGGVVGFGDDVGLDGPESSAEALASLPQQIE